MFYLGYLNDKKFIIGIVVGIVLVTYYPQITTTTTKLFIESGGY